MKKLIAVIAVSTLASCASYDGRGLVPGKSTEQEVVALMGKPAERFARPGGESILFFPRGPAGFHSYAVTIGPDGIMRGIDQRLTVENVAKLTAGTMTKQDVHEYLGPPFLVSYFPRLKREIWEYQLLEVDFKWKLWLQFSDDGVLREVLRMRHPAMDWPGGAKD